MDEQMVPGAYTATQALNIRSQMETKSNTNIVGGYSNGSPFTVYEVYPEKDGIVWGRVSSNVGDGVSRFVGLRVNNQVKARLDKAAEPQKDSLAELVNAINLQTSAITLLATVVRDSAKR